MKAYAAIVAVLVLGICRIGYAGQSSTDSHRKAANHEITTVSYDSEREVVAEEPVSVSYDSGCNTCEKVTNCCPESQPIVYDNDWRAGEADYLHGRHTGSWFFKSEKKVHADEPIPVSYDSGCHTYGQVEQVKVEKFYDTCEKVVRCCPESQPIVYDNDWLAGEADYLHGRHTGNWFFHSEKEVRTDEPISVSYDSGCHTYGKVEHVKVEKYYNTCEKVTSCCEPSQPIVYDNDWRAGKTDLLHEGH